MANIIISTKSGVLKQIKSDRLKDKVEREIWKRKKDGRADIKVNPECFPL